MYSGGLDGTIRRWSLLETDLEKMDKIIEAEPEMIQDFGGGSVLTDEEQKELDELMLNNE